MSKRTLFLIFALFLIAFVLLAMALYQPQAPKVTPVKTVVKESVAQTVLSFGNSSLVASSASTLSYSIPVNISTGKNKVTAVQLELQYDPEILTNIIISPGSFFTKPDVLLNQIDTKTGRISYAFGVGLADEGVVGKGTIANLTFSTKTKTPARTTITFLPKTLVTAQGINESVLKQAIASPFVCGCEENNSTPSAK